MNDFEKHPEQKLSEQFTAMFENLLIYKPGAAFREGLIENPDETFSELVKHQSQYHPSLELSELAEAMRAGLVDTIDRLTFRNQNAINPLQEKIDLFNFRNDQLRVIRNNLATEENEV